MEKILYEYWFASLQGISNKKKIALIETLQTAENIYKEKNLKKYQYLRLSDKDIMTIASSINSWQIEEEYERLISKKISFVTWNSHAYPKRLKPYQDSPYTLFYKGKLPDENRVSVAIVGARRCSPYGEKYAMEYAELMSRYGVQVISGLACGIDGLAQRATIQAGGTSYGILGCGVDICYPKEHKGLYSDLMEVGGVISEFPLGIPPLARNFPQRNRIISGLADIVLVIEAKERSGSLITADLALEQGKDVYALPGPVNSELSRGCNHLIKQGAGILDNPEELLEELGIFMDEKCKKCDENKIILESDEKKVYSCLGLHSVHIDGILRQIDMSISELTNILVSLELKGYIKEISKNYYVRT
ncbi:MAG: DNA-processing protein DprA [Eubacteriales bacterium]